MSAHILSLIAGALLLAAKFPGLQPASAAVTELDRIELPPGFSIDIYAEVPDARSMTLGGRGTLFVGNRRGDSVYAVVDSDGDHRADERYVIANGLNMPNGVAFRDGHLYVAEVSRVLRFDDIESNLDDPPEPVVINDSYPGDTHHGWKFIAFGPDGRLYVPIGAPCNICDEQGYARITRINADGSARETVAMGVRNTVGFDWDPATGDLWFTDNGRDHMGDNRPPDELNHVTGLGQHFGYPYCHGSEIPDPEFGETGACERYRPPAVELGPHVAALGMRFYTASMFPERFHGQIFIAEHGSWNRSVPIGYRVMLVTLENGRAVDYQVFAEGWLQGSRAWGRPVDVLVMPDGALLVSDDKAGVIYRIAYTAG